MIWCVEDEASIRDIEVYALNAAGFDTYVEEHSIRQGRSLKDMSLAEMDTLWDEAKKKGL